LFPVPGIELLELFVEFFGFPADVLEACRALRQAPFLPEGDGFFQDGHGLTGDEVKVLGNLSFFGARY